MPKGFAPRETLCLSGAGDKTRTYDLMITNVILMDGLGWFGWEMVDFVGFGGWFGRFGKVWGDVVCVLYVHQIAAANESLVITKLLSSPGPWR